MADDTPISASGGDPQVTVSGGNLIRYRCQFFLVKPQDEVWPETNSRLKLIHEVVFDQDHAATDTFSLGDPAALESLALSWAIDMKVPGGEGPLEYFAELKIEQADETRLDWSDEGQVDDAKSTLDVTTFKVTP